MKKLSLFFILITLVIYTGCDKCRNNDCPVGPNFSFKVLDDAGKNIAGSTAFLKPYTSDSIQVLALKQNEWEKVNLIQDGSILRFPVENNIQNYIIRYSFAQDDTLSLNIEGSNNECCGYIVNGYTPTINSLLKPVYQENTIYSFVKVADCSIKELPAKHLESEYGCNNTTTGLDIDLSDSLMIIRSQQEFEIHVYGNCDPTIDFSTYDLVIGKKQLTSGLESIDYGLKQDCSNTLKLNVTFNLSTTTEAPNLTYHALIPKLGDNQTVEVALDINNGPL